MLRVCIAGIIIRNCVDYVTVEREGLSKNDLQKILYLDAILPVLSPTYKGPRLDAMIKKVFLAIQYLPSQFGEAAVVTVTVT